MSQAKRLKELEQENARLRKAVSDLSLSKVILKEALLGSTEPGAEEEIRGAIKV